MSLSQKHAGLILVPWFNSEEWHYVYRSAYSQDKYAQLVALDFLRTWKLRTPILSTGVEGTLILLEALSLEEDSMSSEQISNLYSIALVRFLNLSAANSDKQGSFTKTSSKNELPKWLINLRHDIAHGHHVPSLSNLQEGLNFGFQWLRNKYWEPQSKIIKDYYKAQDSSVADCHLSSALGAYVEINMAIFENRDLESEYVDHLKASIDKKFKQVVKHPCLMLGVLLEVITQSLEKHHEKNQLWLDNLISSKALLKPNVKVLEDGNERVEENFRNIWESLLNIIHQYGLLFILVENLFDAIGNISYPTAWRKMAALWIKEVFSSLICLKDSSNTNGDRLKLESGRYSYAKEALHFEKRILHCSNDYVEFFIDSVLNYNSKQNVCGDDILNLVKAGFNTDNIPEGINRIYTIEDLNMGNLLLDDVLTERGNGEETMVFPDDNNVPGAIIAGTKWRKLEDTTMFKNVPLGVLPHQIGQKLPFLVDDQLERGNISDI